MARRPEKKNLRTGFTTGACAAAAAKAACIKWLSMKAYQVSQNHLEDLIEKRIEIPFPTNERHSLALEEVSFDHTTDTAMASIIKEAGDDPDITNGALIVAQVGCTIGGTQGLIIKGGEGVGLVTKPGLPIRVGEPAINPVPRKMITEAMEEVLEPLGLKMRWEVTIHVPEGRFLSKKTLNPRLGIVDGISILGTTGIVKPLSTEAWTGTISTQLRVAKAVGLKEVVISTGRSSERAHMADYQYPEESYIMAGDFIEFSILEAKRVGFSSITLSAQFAKLIKIGLGKGNTHVRYGALDPKEAARLLDIPVETDEINTARELLDMILGLGEKGRRALERFCKVVAGDLSNRYKVRIRLVLSDYNGNILVSTNLDEV